MSSNDELSSDTSFPCDVESLQLAVKGKALSVLSSRVVEEGDMTEEDEDHEDDIRFVTLESRFENKETVLNWQTINLPCLLCKKMVKALFALAKYLT